MRDATDMCDQKQDAYAAMEAIKKLWDISDEEANEVAATVNKYIARQREAAEAFCKQAAQRRQVKAAILAKPASAIGLLGLAI